MEVCLSPQNIPSCFSFFSSFLCIKKIHSKWCLLVWGLTRWQRDLDSLVSPSSTSGTQGKEVRNRLHKLFLWPLHVHSNTGAPTSCTQRRMINTLLNWVGFALKSQLVFELFWFMLLVLFSFVLVFLTVSCHVTQSRLKFVVPLHQSPEL